jgi:phospholipid transport system substrate-binding protein
MSRLLSISHTLASRRMLLFLSFSALASIRSARAESANPAVAIIQRFYDSLIELMKAAPQLSFDQRYDRFQPVIKRTFDLGLMTRLAIGPTWTQLQPDQQQRLEVAFTRYTIWVYVDQFKNYSGERFEVDPDPSANSNGVVVQTRLVKSNGEKVTLNYLVHQAAAGWQVMDVYLSGTISELATRRSEFAAVLRQDGADGLVRALEQRSSRQ